MDEARLCCLTVDVDSLHCYTRFHGLGPVDPAIANAVYDRALPRFAEFFERHGVRATFFLIASDLETPGNREVAEDLCRRGHEIASHSLTHPFPFALQPEAALRREILGSKAALEDALGVAVRGFRAPGLGITPAMRPLLREAGYAWDSSEMPTPWTPLVKRLDRWRSRRAAEDRVSPGYPVLGRRGELLPYRVPAPAGEEEDGLVEMPVSVLPFLRLPFLGTTHFAFGPAAFDLAWRAARRLPFLNYGLHAIELLGLVEDGLPDALRVQFGMRLPLRRKYAYYEQMMDRFGRDYAFATLSDALERRSVSARAGAAAA